MPTLSIRPKNIKRGRNDRTAYYDYGGTDFPYKTLTIASDYAIFFVINNKESKSISWRNDDTDDGGFKHDIVINVKGNLTDGNVIKVVLDEKDEAGLSIQAACLLKFKAQ